MLNDRLETLLAVSEYKNLTRAAEALCLTQPAVSHHIRQLEEECDTKLLIRGKNGIIFTPEGEIAVQYAKRLKALYEKMISEIGDEQRNITRFCIGLTHTSESSNISEILAKFAVENNNTTITIITDTINNLYKKLENYELDAAIISGKRLSAKLNYFMLDTDYLVCTVGKDHPLSRHSIITLDELKKQKMILRLPSSSTRELFEASLGSINETTDNFDVFLEVDNVYTILDLVKKNLGVSILPKSVCEKDANKGKLSILPVENLSMVREIYIAYHKDFSHLEALKKFVELYRKDFRNSF